MEDRPMTLAEHLAELRSRLLRCLLAVVISFFITYSFHEEIFEIITYPIMKALRAHGISSLQALNVTEAIIVYIQASLIAAIILAFPYVSYQVWAFVAPGLYAHERRLLRMVAGLVSGFFFLGFIFCYFVFLPLVADYLIGLSQSSGAIRLFPTVEKTFSLALIFPVVFGLVFQLPLAMFLIGLLGVVRYRALLRYSRYFVVLAFILGAIFTPPDPLSQVLMAVPMCVLYFVGVVFAWAGELLQASGKKTVAKTVATAVVLVFAALVVAVVLFWNRPLSESRTAKVIAQDALYAVRVGPISPLGRACLRALGVNLEAQYEWLTVTGDKQGQNVFGFRSGEKCPGPSVENVCILVGQAPQFASDVDLDKDLVAGFVSGKCLKAMAPFSPTENRSLFFWVEEEGNLITVYWHFEDKALAEWLEHVRESFGPQEVPAALLASPMGQFVAWSAGEYEVDRRASYFVVRFVFMPKRAERALSDLVKGFSKCLEQK